jgi:hypothetical protein
MAMLRSTIIHACLVSQERIVRLATHRKRRRVSVASTHTSIRPISLVSNVMPTV